MTFFPSRASLRRTLIADGIDEFQVDSLPAGIDAALGQAGNRVGIEFPALGDQIHEPDLGLLHHLFGQGARLLVGGNERIGHGFKAPLLASSTLTPSVFIRSVTSTHWKMTPTDPVMVLP